MSARAVPADPKASAKAARKSARIEFRIAFLLMKSVPRIGVGLKEHLDVVHRVDEGIQPRVLVEQKRRAGDDHHPLGVPYAAPDQPAVRGGLARVELPAVGV